MSRVQPSAGALSAWLYIDHYTTRTALVSNALGAQQPACADELHEQAGYFHNHQCRMNYQELREGGWLVGSGMVESGAKQFKARFRGPGMHWSRSGAQKLLPVCASIMSHRFDALWQRAYNSPKS